MKKVSPIIQCSMPKQNSLNQSLVEGYEGWHLPNWLAIPFMNELPKQ